MVAYNAKAAHPGDAHKKVTWAVMDGVQAHHCQTYQSHFVYTCIWLLIIIINLEVWIIDNFLE